MAKEIICEVRNLYINDEFIDFDIPSIGYYYGEISESYEYSFSKFDDIFEFVRCGIFPIVKAYAFGHKRIKTPEGTTYTKANFKNAKIVFEYERGSVETMRDLMSYLSPDEFIEYWKDQFGLGSPPIHIFDKHQIEP